MALQGAYDAAKPNGTHLRPAGKRALWVFRLYRKIDAPAGLPAVSSSILGPVVSLINAGTAKLQQLLGDRQGRILEHEFRFPLIVERLEATPEVRTRFSYTRNGYFLDTPTLNAKGITHFRLSGRTHWTPVFVDGVTVDGASALKTLKELIDDYFFPRDHRRTSDYELYWLNLLPLTSAEDPFGEVEWLIHPLRTGVRTQQSARQPFSWFFNLEFAGLQSNRDKAKSEDGFLDGLLSQSAIANTLGSLGLKSVIQAVKDVQGTVQAVQTFFDTVESVVVAATDYVTGAQATIIGGIGKVRGLLNSVSAIIARIEEGIELVQQLPDLVGDDLRRLQHDFPGLHRTQSPNLGVIATDELRRVEDLLLTLAAQPDAFQAPSVASASLGVPIKPGVTIEQLAAAAGMDAATLIALNGLSYPFVDPQPRPAAPVAGVLYAGEVIRIPQPAVPNPPSVLAINPPLAARVAAVTGAPVDEEDRLFGIDLLLNSDGNLEWDTEHLDLKLERGLQHMANVQVRYVKLPVGQLPYAPNVGNFAYADIGTWQAPEQTHLLAFDMWATLRQDPRVQRIRRVESETRAGGAYLLHDVELINGDTRSFEVPL